MTLFETQANDILAVVRSGAQMNSFLPKGTVRCQGPPAFRTQLARDLGCLLDIDDEVDAWSCLPASLAVGDSAHIPDFLVRRGDRHMLVDAGTGPGHAWLEGAARERGCDYETMTAVSIRTGTRLANARDLLRYSNWQCPLGDRVRLLAALDEVGSMTVADCLPAFREAPPIAALSSLVLHRFVAMDLDEARIGPETMVRRSRA